MFARLALAALAFASLAAVACNGDGGDDDETPTAVASATGEPSPASTVVSDAIRDVPLDEADVVTQLLSDTGGSFNQSDVLYADLTEDGVEDAIVPIASGGTLGFMAFTVLALEGSGEVESILTEQPQQSMGLTVALEGGQLVTVEAVPGPDDPECCPSQLRTTVYAWDGGELAIESQETAPNPQAGASTPGVSP